MRVLKVLAYLAAAFFALALGFGYGNHQAKVRAESLCAAIPAGMAAAEARQALERAGADRLVDTREGVLAVFIGAFQYNRYNCEVVIADDRVGATRLSRID